jgi:adenine specific DNA methylase Mod
MAITYRGQAKRFNRIESKQNASGFQDKSDPGPRQGVGGEDVSLSQAKEAFAKRSGAPVKKKNFYGGEAYFQDGYGGDLASPAKSSPITIKSKSPLKINESLVAGAAITGKKFVDVGAEVGKVFEPEEEPKAADLTK